jgi:hypothetical protein
MHCAWKTGAWRARHRVASGERDALLNGVLQTGTGREGCLRTSSAVRAAWSDDDPSAAASAASDADTSDVDERGDIDAAPAPQMIDDPNRLGEALCVILVWRTERSVTLELRDCPRSDAVPPA